MTGTASGTWLFAVDWDCVCNLAVFAVEWDCVRKYDSALDFGFSDSGCELVENHCVVRPEMIPMQVTGC